jgi:RNA polymerase sigma factor (sigma-70 family)
VTPVPDSLELPFADLLQLVRANDEATHRLLFERYAPQLLALAERRLDRRLRSKAGPDDVMQSAIKSALLRLRDGRLQPTGWDHLWRQMVAITLQKLAHLGEKYLKTRKRDVLLEQRIVASSGEGGAGLDPQAPGDGPVAEALFEETFQQLLDKLSPDQRQILLLHLEGREQGDIARCLGFSQAKVSRALAAAEEALERLLSICRQDRAEAAPRDPAEQQE